MAKDPGMKQTMCMANSSTSEKTTPVPEIKPQSCICGWRKVTFSEAGTAERRRKTASITVKSRRQQQFVKETRPASKIEYSWEFEKAVQKVQARPNLFKDPFRVVKDMLMREKSGRLITSRKTLKPTWWSACSVHTICHQYIPKNISLTSVKVEEVENICIPPLAPTESHTNSMKILLMYCDFCGNWRKWCRKNDRHQPILANHPPEHWRQNFFSLVALLTGYLERNHYIDISIQKVGLPGDQIQASK